MGIFDKKLYFGNSGVGHIKKGFCNAGYCSHYGYPKRHIGCNRNGFEHAEFNGQHSNNDYSLLIMCDACGAERIEYRRDVIYNSAPVDRDAVLYSADVIGECPRCKKKLAHFVIYADGSQLTKCKNCRREDFVIDPVASFYAGGHYPPLSGDAIDQMKIEWGRYTRGYR